MKKVNYTKELLEEKVKDCYSFAELCRRLGLSPEGSNPKTVKKKMDKFGVDYSHFTGQGWRSNNKNPVYRDKYAFKLSEDKTLKSANVRTKIINLGLKENKCEECGITEWRGRPITIQLHHINGIRSDNRIENLRMLCPNCHSQTDNFCRRKELLQKQS